MWHKRIYINCIVLILSVSLLLSACSQSSNNDDINMQRLTYNLGAEPETLDPAMAVGRIEATVQMALFEGLTRINENNESLPGLAEDWEINDEGNKYTFFLRDAKWTNGDPVTAYDFEYAWKRLLNPDTGAIFSYHLWFVKNGEKYTKGEVSAGEVGVKAIDEKTLEVELEAPIPFFLSLTAFPSLYPVNQNIVTNNPNWHTDPETFISNGPFKLKQWDHNQQLVLEKNTNYWASDEVKLDEIIMTMIENQTTELTMFETDKIDVAESPPLAELGRLLEEGKATLHPEISTLFYSFNAENTTLSNKNVRKALAMAIDRQSLVDNIAQASEKTAFAFTPPGVPGLNGDFRLEGGNYFEEDLEKAKRLLSQAGYPNGDDFPVLKLLSTSRGNHLKIAEAIQEMWSKNLNINIEIVNQEWHVYLQSLIEGDYQISTAVWGPDYNNALSFLDMFITGNGNNVANWSNKEYDNLLEVAKKSRYSKERYQAMHKAEKILMDEMPIMPIYFYTNVNMYKPWVKGVIVPVIGGYQDFRWAYISK